MADKKIKFSAVALSVIFVILVYALLGRHDGYLRVNFFDIGQGDAAFITTPQGWQILIDGGPDASVLAKLGEEMQPWDRSIDMVIATHPEADHIAGLIDVLKNYEVGYIVESGLRKETSLSNIWREAVETEGAEVILADSPKRIVLEDKTYIDLLWPLEGHDGEVSANPNNSAIVAKLYYGDRSFLFTADIERWAEQNILANNINIDADILKTPHHGSKTSSSELFLRAVSPEAAIISVGRKNKYGHPHEAIVERFNKMKIPVLRTDKGGDVILESDGKNIFVP